MSNSYRTKLVKKSRHWEIRKQTEAVQLLRYSNDKKLKK
jgi:hypothetical protein